MEKVETSKEGVAKRYGRQLQNGKDKEYYLPFQVVLDRLTEGVIFVDTSLNISFANKQAPILLGVSTEELKNHALHLLLKDGTNLFKRFSRFASSKQEKFEIDSAAGKKTLHLQFSPLAEMPRGERFWLVLLHDITQAENHQKEIHRMMTAIEGISDYLLITDRRGTPLYINHRFKKDFSILFKPDDLIDPAIYYTTESLKIFQEKALPTALNKGIWKGSLEFRKNLRKTIPVWQTIICKKNSAGMVEYFASIATDITEIQQTQRELNLLNRIPEENPSPQIRVNLKGVIESANHASKSILDKWGTKIGNKLPRLWLQIAEKCLKTGKTKEFELDCGKKIFDLRVMPFKDLGYTYIVGNDITRRKRAEIQLSESEQKYRAVVEDQTEMICRFLSNGTITLANKAYCRYFGDENESMEGKNIFNTMPHWHRKKFRERLTHLSFEQPTAVYEQQIKVKGQEMRWQLWTDRAIYDEQGSFIEFQSVGQDITSLKVAEKALKSRELYLRQIIDADKSMIYVHDNNGVFKLVNKAFSSFMKLDIRGIVGKNLKEVFDAEVIDRITEDHLQILNGKKKIIEKEEIFYSTHKNRSAWHQIIKAPVWSADGEDLQVLSVATDISQQKSIEERLRFINGFHELISGISTSFIKLSHREVDNGIEQALKRVVEFLGIERAYISIKSTSSPQIQYSYIKGEAKYSIMTALSTLSFKDFDKVYENMKQEGYVLLYPQKCNEYGEKFERFLLSKGTQSYLSFPILQKGIIVGQLVLSADKNNVEWKDDTLALVKILSQLFSNVLERKATEELLAYQADLENLITTISANFIHIHPSEINKEISSSLKYLTQFLGANDALILMLDSENNKARITHSYFDNRPEFNPTLIENLTLREFVWAYRQFQDYGVVTISNTSELPQNAGALKTLMDKLQLLSLIGIPILSGIETKGVIIIASQKRHGFWVEDTIPLLKIISQVFANAIERRNADENLRETQELYRTLASNIPKSSVMLFDRHMKLLISEGGESDFLGTNSKDVERLEDALSNRQLKVVRPLFEKALSGQESMIETEFNDKTYQLYVLPVKNNLGAIYAGLSMAVDITDQKSIQYELERQTEELKRSNEDLEMFAYAASHDLQEPLRMVSSYVHLIKKKLGEDLPPQTEDFIKYAVDGVVRMQDLINDLLEYSRVDRKGNPFVQVDLNNILHLVRSNLKKAIEDSESAITADSLPVVKADQFQMVSLLQNLIENAIKFRKPNTRPVVNIGVKEYKRYWEISIRDNGIGIEDRYFNRIFTIFQRLNSRQVYSGTGIGLAICKKIVERHKGRIWVESTLGEGSCFIFELPK